MSEVPLYAKFDAFAPQLTHVNLRKACRPLLTELETNRPVKARFWPWLEPLSVGFEGDGFEGCFPPSIYPTGYGKLLPKLRGQIPPNLTDFPILSFWETPYVPVVLPTAGS